METVVQGGKPIYGVKLGLLLLDTRMPRIVGDVGNAHTWPFPMMFHVVEGATPDLVRAGRIDRIADLFEKAGKHLVETGVEGVATSCGFLSVIQDRLSTALQVPVASSSLLQVPAIQALLPPGRKVGIVTIWPETITSKHLTAAGIEPGSVVVAGCDRDSSFAKVRGHAP